MTQGPWSVKGIDPKARSAAREKAQREGKTLGQFLNALLLEDTPKQDSPSDEIVFDRGSDNTTDELRRVRADIDDLAGRLEATQSRSAKAIAGIDKSMMGLVGRVDESAKAQLTALERVTRAMSEIDTTQAVLRDRIVTLEGSTESGPTIAAIQELEVSLGRLAQIVRDKHLAHEEEQASARDQLDSRFERLANALQKDDSSVTDRVEHIEKKISTVERRMDNALDRFSDATSRFETMESKAERAASDATWRLERALETSTQRSRSASKELQERVDTVEAQTREAVTSLGDAVSKVIDRLTNSERSAEGAIKSVERTVTGLGEQLERLQHRGDEDYQRLESQLHNRLDALVVDLAEPIKAVRADVEQRVEEALRSGEPEKLQSLESSMRELQERLELSENRQADAVVSMSQQVERLSEVIEERLSTASGLDPEALAQIREEMEELAERLETRVSFVEMDRKMGNTGVEQLRAQLNEVSNSVDERLTGISGQLEEVATSGTGADAEEFERIAEKIDERVRDSERRSAQAITQIGEQVARVAERLQTQHTDSLRKLEERLGESERSHETRIKEALSDVSRRMDELGDVNSTSLSPVHKTVASLAQRVSDLEDNDDWTPTGRAPDNAQSMDESALDLGLLASSDDELLEDDLSQIVFVDSPDDAQETEGTVGVDPPPFDDPSASTDEQLFGNQDTSIDKLTNDPKLKPQESSSTSDPSAKAAIEDRPAEDIDDLLDIDDVLLADKSDSSEFVVALHSDKNATSSDFIAEARRAAAKGNRVPISSTMSVSGRRAMTSGPLMASAALALAVAGGGAWSVMRGKQDDTGESFAKEEPSTPKPASDDIEGAAEVLFANADDAAMGPAADLLEDIETTQDAGIRNAQSDRPDNAPETTRDRQPEPLITLASAVDSGDPVALHDYALELLQTGEKARAVALLKEAADKDLVMAQYRLAKLYERGEGVPRDIAASRRWTEEAAIGGNVRAMHDLAVFYAEGDAGPQSYAAAVEWFRQAADLGLLDSQYNLAVLYEQGLGVSEDLSQAAFWFDIASRAGDPDAARRARTLLADMPEKLASDIQRRSRTFVPKAENLKANGDLGIRPWDEPGSEDIAELQRMLNRLGYEAGTPDGAVGARTREAIRSFERDQGQQPSGRATLSVLRRAQTAASNGAG